MPDPPLKANAYMHPQSMKNHGPLLFLGKGLGTSLLHTIEVEVVLIIPDPIF